MNDLGWDLVGLAARVAVLLGPALVLQARASRGEAGRGAWVAAWSLGLVVALGATAVLGPRLDRHLGPSVPPIVAAAPPLGSAGVAGGAGVEAAPNVGMGRAFDWRGAWDRLGRRASAPARAVRPWGGTMAVVIVGAMAVALIRLAVGLAAVAACRRRGGRGDDPGLLGLVAELRASLGVRCAVEVRVVADLATAATAGWLRPVLLLPAHWADWTLAERRAVVAHELAHVARGDYATGLLGRVAVALNGYHPLVWWMDARLRLEQELAADALAARVVGGRAGYLVALAGLALKQDGRSQHGLARAFLPAQGTLIRRIAMLKLDDKPDRNHRAPRLATAGTLLALAALAASWRGPALVHADDEPAAPAAPVPVPAAPPVEVGYVPDQATGVLAYRPAVAARRAGMGRFVQLFRMEFGFDPDLIGLQEMGHVVPPGTIKLRDDQIESVVVGFATKAHSNKPGEQFHTLNMHGVTARTVAPFDWPGFLRGMGMKVEEVREGEHASYRITCRILEDIKMPLFAFLPDDRTLVMDGDPAWIKEVSRRAGPSVPAYLRGADWARASRGVLAIAIDNAGDRFARDYDLKAGRPDDAAILALLRGVDRCVLGVADADPLGLHAEATARDPEAAGAAGRALDGLFKLGRARLAADPTAPTEPDPGVRLATRLLGGLKVAAAGATVTVDAPDAGTDADLAAWLKRFDDPVDEALRRKHAEKPAPPPAGKP